MRLASFASVVTSAAMRPRRAVTSGVSVSIGMCCLALTCVGAPVGSRFQRVVASPTGKPYGPRVSVSALRTAASSSRSRGRHRNDRMNSTCFDVFEGAGSSTTRTLGAPSMNEPSDGPTFRADRATKAGSSVGLKASLPK